MALAVPGRILASAEPDPPTCLHNLSANNAQGCSETTAQPLDDLLNQRSYTRFTLGQSLALPKKRRHDSSHENCACAECPKTVVFTLDYILESPLNYADACLPPTLLPAILT